MIMIFIPNWLGPSKWLRASPQRQCQSRTRVVVPSTVTLPGTNSMQANITPSPTRNAQPSPRNQSPSTAFASASSGGAYTSRVVSGSNTLNQFFNRFAVIQQVLRSAAWVHNGCGHRVDAKVVVDRGQNFLHVNRSFNDVFAKLVRCTNCLA